MKRIVVTGISMVLFANCKTPAPKSESTQKSIFNTTAEGAEIISDMSECVAKMGSPDYSKVYDDAATLVKEEVDKKIQANPELKDRAISSIDLFKENIDFKGVTAGAVKYVEQRKPEIYSLFGYKLASVVPTGMTLMFYHPVLNEIDLSAWTKKVIPSTDVKLRPYIGVVVVPTCVTTVDATNKNPKTSWRFRMGASFIGIWRMQPAVPGGANGKGRDEGKGPKVTEVQEGWHVMWGFVWGALYEPNQLRGPMFGFNGSFANKKSKGSKVNLPNEAIATRSPKTGEAWNLVLRPMVMWGYKDPKDAKGFRVKSVIDSFVGNALDSDTGIKAPTHFTMLFDVTNEVTEKSYVHPYLGFQVTSSDVVESFFQRPIITSKNKDGTTAVSSGVEDENH